MRGLRTTHGNYRSVLRLFGMRPQDYQRFHNFLIAHECKVDYRALPAGRSGTGARSQGAAATAAADPVAEPATTDSQAGAAEETADTNH